MMQESKRNIFDTFYFFVIRKDKNGRSIEDKTKASIEANSRNCHEIEFVEFDYS